LWGEPLAAAAEQVRTLRAKAAQHGRNPGVSISFRPILAATEAAAWDRAATILEGVKANRAGVPPRIVNNDGSRRLLEFAAEGDILDQRLFTAIAKVTGAAGNSTALVGTPDQVAQAMLAYYDAGATTFLIRGFDPLDDAVAYGRDLLPIVHAEVAKRDREAQKTRA
jgi:alkanesulfonate monooxygenase